VQHARAANNAIQKGRHDSDLTMARRSIASR
jgi:hypothetical protein